MRLSACDRSIAKPSIAASRQDGLHIQAKIDTIADQQSTSRQGHVPCQPEISPVEVRRGLEPHLARTAHLRRQRHGSAEDGIESDLPRRLPDGQIAGDLPKASIDVSGAVAPEVERLELLGLEEVLALQARRRPPGSASRCCPRRWSPRPTTLRVVSAMWNSPVNEVNQPRRRVSAMCPQSKARIECPASIAHTPGTGSSRPSTSRTMGVSPPLVAHRRSSLWLPPIPFRSPSMSFV